MKGPVIRPHRNLNLNPFRRRVQKQILPEHIKQLVAKLEHTGRDNIILALKENFPCLTEAVDTCNYNLRYISTKMKYCGWSKVPGCKRVATYKRNIKLI